MSTVEISVLLALLVGGALLSVDLLGALSEEQFHSVSVSLDEGKKPNPRAEKSHDETKITQSRPTLFARAAAIPPSHACRYGLMACLLIALGVAFYRLKRGDHGKPAELQDEALAALGEPLPKFVAKRQEIMRTLAGDFSRLLMSDLLVRDLMTTEVTTAPVDMPIEELAELMKKLEVRHMIIADDEKAVLGVISDRDLSHRGKKTGDIMTRNPLTVSPDALMRPAMSLMLDRHISSLPVVENGKLVGIVTTTDLVMAFQCTMQVVQSAAAELLQRAPIEA